MGNLCNLPLNFIINTKLLKKAKILKKKERSTLNINTAWTDCLKPRTIRRQFLITHKKPLNIKNSYSEARRCGVTN